MKRILPELINIGRALPPVPPAATKPDWQAADPRWIRHALARSQELPSGGWYVIDATRNFGSAPQQVTVCGQTLVVWRSGSQLLAALDACPHMGAPLSEGRVCEGKLVCPWHGLELGPGREDGHGFNPLPTHDDGYLLWVQLAAAGHATKLSAQPYLPARPAHGIAAVIRRLAQCEPQDVVVNRLDPWHGVHYHPHSFGRLRVIAQAEDAITVRVAYRLLGPIAVEVDACFHCPDPRSIVMTIVAGDGVGSVVETHATPISPGVTAVVELTLASSERPGFRVAEWAAPVLRPVMSWAAQRLWVEDARYAERVYALRHKKVAPASSHPTSETRAAKGKQV
ncbi:MAG: hypothetical protein RL701_157 [Pseudomonadota bacterium]